MDRNRLIALIRVAYFNYYLPLICSEYKHRLSIHEYDFAFTEIMRFLLERPGRGHQRAGLWDI